MGHDRQQRLLLVGIAEEERRSEPLNVQEQCPPYTKYFLQSKIANLKPK